MFKCERCNSTENSIIQKKEVISVRGEEKEINSNIRICVCGNELFDEVLEEGNLTRAYDEYRKNHDILSPLEIKKIRGKYGLPQRTLGRVLGWGEVTIHRYETGAIPDASHNKILKLLGNPEVMKNILVEARDSIPNSTFKRAMRKIELLLEENEENDFLDMFQKKLKYSIVDIESGYTQFDLQKFINTVLFFSGNMAALWKTKLNKLLFYSDFKYFKEYTISLTGGKYIKLDYGPVPKNYDGLLSILETLGLININPTQIGSYSGFIIQALADYDPDAFSKEELCVLEEVKDKLCRCTSGEISDISHKEKGWIETPFGQIISYKYASELIC